MNIFSVLNGYVYSGNLAWLNDVYSVLPDILWAMLAVLGGAGAVYAIFLGVNLAKSESDDKRKAAANRIKNTIIGIGVLLILVLLVNIFLPMILAAVPAFKDYITKTMIGL